ncbi:MAG TPA: peptidyl-prolyl cis-trans isomerase [Actinomycetota bacterium]|nr:peptidyl-prolyl cis-trans isomerase [Actinomycetota bacterium]
MRPARRLLLVLAAVLATTGCADQLTPAAALVDGERITEATVERELEHLRDDPQYQTGLAQVGEEFRGEERRRLLTILVQVSLVRRELERRDQPVTEQDVDQMVDRLALQYGGRERLMELAAEQKLDRARFRELVRRQAAVEKLQRVLTADVQPEATQVQAAYEERQAIYQQARLSRITVGEREEATRIVERVEGGASFETLARQAENGEDLGWVDLRTVDEATRTEIEGVPDGGVAGPVQTGSGFHVYQVHERRTAPLEDVRAEILDQLLVEQRQQALGRFLRERGSRSRIVVNPKYGRFDPERFAIVPNDPELPE